MQNSNVIKTQSSLVSVVIPCYNHASFLPRAIQSIVEQTHKNTEIIVVDDGSVDNTREVASGYSGVKYVYQPNQGLSAARNTGIVNSSGRYLLFLDADDWLLPDGIEKNLRFFSGAENIGFVSGNYLSYYEADQREKRMKREIKQRPYADLLLYNHIKMHASVLFPRWVFDTIRYDTSLKSSEDWDLYLRITRSYPIIQHDHPIAVYRRYGTSMSRNNVVMLKTGLQVLTKQIPYLSDETEKENLAKGRNFIIDKFTTRIYKQLEGGRGVNIPQMAVLLQYNRLLFLKFAASKLLSVFGLQRKRPSFGS